MHNEFRLGSVLERGFRVFFHNIVTFVLVGVVFELPAIAYGVAVQLRPDLVFANWEYATMVPTLLVQFFSLLVVAAVMHGAFQEMRGQRASVGACVSVGLKSAVPVFGLALVMYLSMGLVVAAVVVPVFSLESEVALILAIPALIVVVFLYCGWWVAIPVIVVERVGVRAALRRSWELTRGHRGSIFGLLLLLGLLSGLVGGVIGAAADSSYAQLGLNVLFSTLGAVMNAVGYHDLRLAKDGIEETVLESVFD